MTFLKRLRAAWAILIGSYEEVERPGLFSRDPVVVGDNPSRLTRLMALKLRNDLRFEKGARIDNDAMLTIASRRSFRLVVMMDAILNPMIAAYREKHPKKPAAQETGKCQCVGCVIGRKLAALGKNVSVQAYAIKENGDVKHVPCPIQPLKSEAELDELVRKFHRNAGAN